MPRVTKANSASKRHKKVLKATKGHYGARIIRPRSNLISNHFNMHLEIEKNKKRSFRSLWISRINSGAKELGVTYSSLIAL